MTRSVTVFGAYGHTGRFVVSELRRRGWTPILSGRDPDKLTALAAAQGGLDVRPAAVDAASLDRAMAGAAAVINCAGPFVFTAAPVIEAAIRARIPYLDVGAEVEVAAETFHKFGDRAAAAGVLIVPSIGFYGGLGDLLATAVMSTWSSVDEVCVAYALSSWKPTAGTRATIAASKRRRGGRRLVFAKDRLELRTDAAPVVDWTFPAPIGEQPVIAEFTTADSVTIARHIKTSHIRTFMTLAALQDLSDPDASAPIAADDSGRSSQLFLVEAVVRRNGIERRAVARGRDIYAITAPMVVEATERVLRGHVRNVGVAAAGEIFDARDFLRALAPADLSLELSEPDSRAAISAAPASSSEN